MMRLECCGKSVSFSLLLLGTSAQGTCVVAYFLSYGYETNRLLSFVSKLNPEILFDKRKMHRNADVSFLCIYTLVSSFDIPAYEWHWPITTKFLRFIDTWEKWDMLHACASKSKDREIHFLRLMLFVNARPTLNPSFVDMNRVLWRKWLPYEKNIAMYCLVNL